MLLWSKLAPSFSELLKSWRRVRKVSQFNLSLDAGVSQKHLSFLESGRSSPSRDMILCLSKALELPLREQNTLLNAAGFAKIFTENSIDTKDLEQARKALVVMLDHLEPYGAIVLDRNWNIVMMNQANIKIFSKLVDPVKVWSDIGGDTPNIIRLCLHPKGLKPHILNWEDFASYFVEHLHREILNNPYNLSAKSLQDEIKDYPDVPNSDHSLDDTSIPYLQMKLQVDGSVFQFFTMVSTFGTPLDITLQELRIETFFPGDKATEKFIRSL
ncbi:MAG: transcriptional regulator with XRE-family HTH domain [Candidatus Azotimanducaceae bacterium]|jgi:transcriptional regulator with XRE-family HTH domain